MSQKVMASLSAFGVICRLLPLWFSTVWKDLSYGPMSPCVSPVFICSSGDLVVHLLLGERGGISRSEVVSRSHPY